MGSCLRHAAPLTRCGCVSVSVGTVWLARLAHESEFKAEFGCDSRIGFPPCDRDPRSGGRRGLERVGKGFEDELRGRAGNGCGLGCLGWSKHLGDML
ncbi:hypothetical protein [Desulfosporosinus sp.]|uniref:hypothetical protein n=1 Tax=Desulfosporosinus sp. TaxID=157907 RepID=UPI0025C4A80E|nr:hypothetical protein [Desulfosporosinus sp.]MBC2721356.1 hypothetical protein [Desulfosporosinus sp.]MBC2728790.1 hypothetical protein [Desulfosporosinus sp.]